MNFQELLQLVKESLYCQVCGQSFDEAKVELAGLQGNSLLFHAYCDKGHFPSNTLIKAMAPTSLPIKDIVDKFQGEPISIDEVLDLTNLLKGFDGNFETAFALTH